MTELIVLGMAVFVVLGLVGMALCFLVTEDDDEDDDRE